jgi:V/A-type H+/Na+-transporting ATPase subunit E
MARTLGDITNELAEKVLSPAKAEADKIINNANNEAGGIIRDAEQKAAAVMQKATSEAAVIRRQMEIDMDKAARNFIIMLQERIENSVMSPAIEEEIVPPLEDGDFLPKIIEMIIKEFINLNGKENRVEVLLPERHKKQLEAWFLNRFEKKMLSGVTVHFTDKITFGFKLGVEGSRSHFNFSAGLLEVFAEFCAPRFRKHFSPAVQKPDGIC